MGGYDRREPLPVATKILVQLRDHWITHPPLKPVMLITQGDPYEERGISAITRLVADQLGAPRALIFLDPEIVDYHKPNADLYGVISEICFSILANKLREEAPQILGNIEDAVKRQLACKNAKRKVLGKPALGDHYLDFALLQEVTKVACKRMSGNITIAHTSNNISEFSVSSFYKVGLELGLINVGEIIPYLDHD